MEVDLVTSGLLEEETFGLDDNNDHKDFEGGRYGLCMDIIIDRGVLDCCQNWQLSAWTKVSMQPAEEVMSKVKVVFSTLNSKSNDVSDSEDRLMLENDIPNYSPCCLENHNGTGIGSSPMEAGTKSSVLSESLPKEESGEQPDAECEELYGPDKEPLVNRFPELVEFPAENSIPQDDENHQLNQSGRASRSESEGFRENNVVASAGDDNLIQVRNFRARGRRRYSILTLTS
ncbi:hypothetical protein HS088_TW15G00490 [Tripterygium wilfordii]|uniref:Uncharacterized protein n=1 Tax=Tripterygium wilfordii TaxID=458696 RepID=A0A7J7CLV1_TRIWF|nr:hypothetical protein HS088_TW15G00490 [Tripterygium wilfordii]